MMLWHCCPTGYLLSFSRPQIPQCLASSHKIFECRKRSEPVFSHFVFVRRQPCGRHLVLLCPSNFLQRNYPWYVMSQLVCVDDYENYALKNLPRNARDYYKSGAGDEQTLNLNKNRFKVYRVRPRVLRDVSNRDLCTTVLGMKVSMPLGISPTAMQRMAHPDGECASARAAGAAGTIFTLSTIATSSIEEVAAAAPNTIKWFQLYVYNDRNVTQQLVQRAEKAGFKALVVTVDTPILGNRREDVRNKFSLPNHLRLANLEGVLPNQIQKAVKSSALSEYVATMLDETLNWQDLAWLKSVTKLPIVLKGILTAEDAILAVKHGASAILVSNHGGRQVDRCPSTIEALPEIVKAVGDKVEIYLDGGVRQGIDVFIALALGARMVFFGRPVLWGLTHDGEKGVTAILQMMREEISLALALTGCKSIKDITSDMVIHESYYSRL